MKPRRVGPDPGETEAVECSWIISGDKSNFY